MSAFQTLKLIGKLFSGELAAFGEGLGITLFTLGLILWTLIPLYDGKHENGRRARNATYFGLLALGIIVVTTIWGYMSL